MTIPDAQQIKCSRGCHDNFGDHVRDLHIGKGKNEKKDLKKITVDIHDNHTVDVIDFYDGDRRAVTVHPPTLKLVSQVQMNENHPSFGKKVPTTEVAGIIPSDTHPHSIEKQKEKGVS